MNAHLGSWATSGFGNLAQFAVAVAATRTGGGLDNRLVAMAGDASAAASEGYVIPAEFKDRIWDLVLNQTDLIGMTHNEVTTRNRVNIVKEETTPWGAEGIKAQWRQHGSAAPNATSIMLNRASVPLHELHAYTIATSELLEDAPFLGVWLTIGAASAIRWTASNSIMWGSGAGQPLGFMKSKALIVSEKEAGQSSKTITAQNVANMYARLIPGSVRNARWFLHSDALPQVMTMKVDGQPIWTPPIAGFADAPGGFLLGRPIELTEHAAELGELGDIVFADLTGYYMPTKSDGIDLKSSIHLWFDHGLEAFRWIFRVGGQPLLSKPVNAARGGTTKSHFVALEPR